MGKNNIVKHSIACIPNLKCSMMVRKLVDEAENPIVECKFNEKLEKWEPLSKTEQISKVDDV
jgi:hypothetical protein